MASQNVDSSLPDGKPVTGLESRLRGLILSSVSSNNGRLPDSSQLDDIAQLTRVGHEAPAEPSRQHELSHKSNKRRPNQAQRRQMNSHLFIPIDPRPQQPQYMTNRGGMPHGHFHRPPRLNQEHPQAVPSRTATAWVRHEDKPYEDPSWKSSPDYPSTNTTWDLHCSPRGRHVPPLALQQGEMPSTQTHQYTPGPPQAQRRYCFRPGDIALQAEYLERLCYQVVSKSEIEVSEIAEKEAFRQRIEVICRNVISFHEQQENSNANFHPMSVELKCFGSLSSGFATKFSDMDLGLLSPMSQKHPDATDSPIPRLLEKALLEAGLGARLLSRTRVPIIKLCEKPSEHLRQALLAERKTWENGIRHDGREGANDDDLEQDAAPQSNVDGRLDSTVNEPNMLSQTEAEVSRTDGDEESRFQLKQGLNHSLSAYYSLAKRVLRRAGGRDVTLSNHCDFTASDWTILNGVCQASIQGLTNQLLRERLARSRSLSFQARGNMSGNRSLHGVFTQVEGEHVVMSWDSWPAKRQFHDSQPQVEQALSTWNSIQQREDFGIDPVSYTKDLQLALEKIKRIPSVQLMLLEQGQHETPSQYCMRTKGILSILQQGLMEDSEAIEKEVVNRYISGVTQSGVRQVLESLVNCLDRQPGLEVVGLWHQSYHLVKQLGRALDEHMFDTSQKRDVRDYIELLKSPIRRIYTGPGHHSYRCVVPVPSESIELVLRIAKLRDVPNLAPNQPRDRYRDPLEFPATGAGVQCDINFSAYLALQNTALLRCYSLTDARVRPIVLFVKHWAKVRGINSGYRGTLSSYGFVLMVLHYLVNVAKPFVCPNLQQLAPPPPSNPSLAEIESTLWCRGCNIQFWRNETELLQLSASNRLNCSRESIGQLLRGFFEYFAHSGVLTNGLGKGFDWGRDVLSLRTPGGLLRKQEKGWTGAKTVFQVQGGSTAPNPQPELEQDRLASGTDSTTGRNTKEKAAPQSNKSGEVKEIRHRYLFAIEDPFELDHNVARTVTHNGIVSIRDEFRRAWRIIRTSDCSSTQEDLLQDTKDTQEDANPLLQLLDNIHGPQGTWGTVV
ncbi:hypothetical protein CDD83_7576 [Cordyceps sp. RAO-2017]|nr:hypothetical protein CDD83_7576 [Cordyceps sp. RAO-2017]